MIKSHKSNSVRTSDHDLLAKFKKEYLVIYMSKSILNTYYELFFLLCFIKKLLSKYMTHKI